jgi:hypothetical protein
MTTFTHLPFAKPVRNLVIIAMGKLKVKPNAKEKKPLKNIVISRIGLLPNLSDSQPQK